jgi:hypothetical protein
MLSRVEDLEVIWTNLVAEIGEAFDIPGPMGDWTFKDLAQHLNGWRIATVNKLEAAANGREPGPSPWPAEHDLIADEDAKTEAINEFFQQQGRDRSYADILAEANEQFSRLRTAIEAIPEDDLADVNKFPWMNGHSPSDVLRGTWDHLTEEHLRGIRSWLLSRQYNLASTDTVSTNES